MKTKIIAFFHFNKGLFLWYFFISLGAINLQIASGYQGVFTIPVWIKLFSYVVLYYLNNQFRQQDYYLYHNLELSKNQLYYISFSTDFFMFLTLILVFS